MGSAVLGIDIGMTSVKMALIDDGQVLKRVYRRHHGNPLKVIREEVEGLGLDGDTQVVATGSNAELFHRQSGVFLIDPVRCEITAVRRVFPQVRNIMNIGGSSVGLIILSEEGNFQGFSANSLCAAGTGSFLDEQAERLGISYGESIGFIREEEIPNIATRCAVFAKSDIIHRQQEGYSKSAMWSALCKGMTETMLQTLLKGKPLRGLTVITGGVSLNGEVIYWLKRRYGDMVHTYQDAHLSGAVGAALSLSPQQGVPVGRIPWGELTDQEGGKERGEIQKPLMLLRSKYPGLSLKEDYIDPLDNEVRISRWPSDEEGVYLGIDIGSTSTKMVVMDEDERVLIDIYRRTAGDPIGATKLLFSSLVAICQSNGVSLTIRGCGTTGSGRKLVGAVVGADCVINEISAHVTGALKVDPSIDTIFEIGGQDSKYMRIKGGHIYDANMNYACAAGTGSFVEEQARKLGFPLNQVGDMVMGISPPRTSDRCTVFMEQDINRLLKRGYDREECMAAVMYSVIQNYLNKVVGRRYISKEKIFFQGATARNKGLVAALENLLGVEVVVSPYCHVMGAYGVAILTRRWMERAKASTRFKGLDLAGREVKIRHDYCNLCRDHCKISYATIEGEEEEPSWGYMCGREPSAKGKRLNQSFTPFKLRERLLNAVMGPVKVPHDAPIIALPRSLTTYTFYPLWRHFFQELGFRVMLSPPTSPETISDGIKLAAADFCFPIKLSLGHLYSLAKRDGIDYIFLPFMISNERNRETSNSYFCPFVQSFAGMARTVLALNDMGTERILSPVVDLRWPQDNLIDNLNEELGKRLRLSKGAIGEAWKRAWAAQREFNARCQAEGRKLLEELADKGEIGIVCIGRPYNTMDLGANLSLPRKVADFGYRVIPIDMIPPDTEGIDPYSNMFWSYGQKILNAVRLVRKSPNLFAIYFTNFNCGPDSFILNFAEHEMGGKPMLVLEVDEHGADTGYMTRIEAFLDVVRAWKPKEERRRVHFPKEDAQEFRRRVIWIPPMHPIASRLFASAFRGYGYRCQALPNETREDMALGRALARGSECLPMATTIGSFINMMRRIKADPKEHAFFMPTADGPCRFGQYALLHRMILNRIGYQDIPILSPSSQNTYQGLEEDLRRHLFKSLAVADILTKCACRIRPYEITKGQTDEVLEAQLKKMERAFEDRAELIPALSQAVEEFGAIPVSNAPKPLVGVVGEIYVRCNIFCNEDLIRAIEDFGGEAWLAPMVEWILYTSEMERWERLQRRDGIKNRLASFLKNYLMIRAEHNLMKPALKILNGRVEPPIADVLEEGRKYVPLNFGGEAILTLGRAAIFARQGAKMVVNCAPFSCMPGAITAAILQRMERELKIPIVSLFYDGEGGLNERLKFFMHNITP